MLHSQTVDGINLAEKTEITYLEILDRQFGFKLKNHGVIIDIGQNTDNFYKSGKVLSPAGTSIEFNSGIDALNHFTQWGWDLLYQPIINADSSGNYVVYHYFLKRRK
jgi:hypothetical protein